jgi:hypothetical protein
VFLSLLKGHLLADGVGLISHTVFGVSGGIYGRMRSMCSAEAVLLIADLSHGRERFILNSNIFLKGFISVFLADLVGLRLNPLRGLPSASLLFDPCGSWFAVVVSCRTPNPYQTTA